MIEAANKILGLIIRNKSGRTTGITSVCSSNRYVIKAAILTAKKNNEFVLIESTSNQVDQFGGYMGITPGEFREYVFKIARQADFPIENVILGGDHLGPNRWQGEKAESAMQKAKDQITAYIKAGYSKIHLDSSMKCADDGNKAEPLDKSVVAERAAVLCRAAENTFNTYKDFDQPVYIIGTDVPPPGGAFKEQEKIHVTTPDDAQETIDQTCEAFERYNLQDAWKRVVGVVVQPGVEFGDHDVFDYDRTKASGLIKLIKEKDNLIYEAHSTDYQKKESLREMVEDHFAILKVGPWLTFAFREAVFALAAIENELLSDRKYITLSNLISVIDDRMIHNQQYWARYYYGNEEEKRFKRKFSYSDRIRYYWTDKFIDEALRRLISNLKQNRIPDTLISQYLPDQYYLIRNMKFTSDPEDLILNKIFSVLEIYNYATHGGVN